jgi:hypothetical protein
MCVGDRFDQNDLSDDSLESKHRALATTDGAVTSHSSSLIRCICAMRESESEVALVNLREPRFVNACTDTFLSTASATLA